jgi:predicted DNA-binding transcriptional regulator YafY
LLTKTEINAGLTFLNTDRERIKRDRSARLIRLVNVLFQNPQGLPVDSIAQKCGVCLRTAYRDLEAVDTEMSYKIWQDDKIRGLVKDQFLPPISFSPVEALNIFFAARLMLNYTQKYDPNIASIFTKLASIVSPNLRQSFQETLDWMQKQPRDDEYLKKMFILAECWIKRHKVKISYRSYNKDKAAERMIEPYFIEPVASGHASYVVAFCHLTKEIRTFKIGRIESIVATAEEYVIPADFDANAYFQPSWGIITGEPQVVKLKFVKELTRIVQETPWHPSQRLELKKDGTVIMTLNVADSWDFRSWILGWGERILVLQPASLRKEITQSAMKMVGQYSLP